MKAYNASKEAASNGQPDTWQEHKANRQSSIADMMVNLANNRAPASSEMNQLFTSLIENASGEEKAARTQMRDTFLKQLQQLKASQDDPEKRAAVLTQLDTTLESVLAEQHTHWNKQTIETDYKQEPYRARHRPLQ